MWEFIAKYWLEFAFGILAAAAIGAARYFRNLVRDGRVYQKSNKEKEQEEKLITLITDMKTELQENDQAQNVKIDALMAGTLALWKKIFLEDGYELLDSDHHITTDELIEFTKEHNVYKTLGGNDTGDKLFEMVTKKYESTVHKT